MKNLVFKIISRIQLVIYTLLYFCIPRFTKVNIWFFGKLIIVPDFASFYAMYKESFVNNIYFFDLNTQEDKVIIEGGANIGITLLYYAFVYPNAQIIGIEPDPELYEILKINISKFKLSRVTLINKALWNHGNQKITFYKEGADGGRVSNVISQARMVTVKTTTLTEITREFDKINFLNLDIEGTELEALQNQKSFLSKTQKAFIEYHSFLKKPQNITDLLSILIKSGFRIKMIETMSNKNLPFITTTTNLGMDLQLNIFLTK